MKKKLVIALCLVMSLSLLLCSCGTDNSQSDNNTDVKTTAAPTLIPQGESQSIPTTGNDDPIVTVPSISEDEIAEPSEDIVTDPSEDDATEPSEVPAEPTVAPTEPTVAPTKPTVAPTKPSTPTQAHKHSYTAKVTKAATCTTAGVKTYTCYGCQHQYTEAIAAAGHKKDSGTVTKAATCSATGVKTYKCVVCQTVMETATIAKTAHKKDSGTVTKAATCTATGTKTYKCSVCKTSMGTETIAATGHKKDSGTVTKAATCTATGIKTYKCSVCKTVMETATIAKIAHKWGSWSYSDFPNPEEPGEQIRTCSSCKKTETKTVDKATYDGPNYYCNHTSYKAVKFGDDGLTARHAYWKDGSLYLEYFLVNNTTSTIKIKGIESMTISYWDEKTGQTVLLAQVSNHSFNQTFTVKADEYWYGAPYEMCISKGIVKPNYSLAGLSISVKFIYA